MENIDKFLKIKYEGKQGDFDVYFIDEILINTYDLKNILNYCEQNNLGLILNLENKRILTFKLK